MPHFTYWNQRGTTEQLHYEFPDKRAVTAGEVFWYNEGEQGSITPPKEWRIRWRDAAGKFHPVNARDDYRVAPDRFNRVEFDPVETTAIRLELDTLESSTNGIHEFRLDEKAAK
ncbi:MAG: hypothetical protein ACI8XO_004199 [Verrucomicrobiales bacterium]|jgi:hypothetical protein